MYGKTNLKAFLVILVFLLVMGGANAQAASLHLRATTDKDTYIVGEEVQWTIWAWASEGDNRGVASLEVNFDDNRNEALNGAIKDLYVEELEDTEYGLEKGFTLKSLGTPNESPPRLRRIEVRQDNKMLDVGNDGEEYIFAKGKYVITKPGPHDLTASINSAYYWPDETGGPQPFTPDENYPEYISVITDPNIDGEGIVNFKDFALMANNWQRSDCNAGNDWCVCTDLDNDSNVDVFELEMLALYWLQ